MPQRSLEYENRMNLKLEFKVNKPWQTVFENLIDMDKFVSFHPVIDKIEPLSVKYYLVHETLKFAFLSVSFKYDVFLSSNPAKKTVEMKATVMKFTKIEMFFALKSEDNSTTVIESIHFKSPFPIKKIMSQIFKKQHSILFANMNT
jgi:carbon monoxide dehydrogenase subunit G